MTSNQRSPRMIRRDVRVATFRSALAGLRETHTEDEVRSVFKQLMANPCQTPVPMKDRNNSSRYLFNH